MKFITSQTPIGIRNSSLVNKPSLYINVDADGRLVLGAQSTLDGGLTIQGINSVLTCEGDSIIEGDLRVDGILTIANGDYGDISIDAGNWIINDNVVSDDKLSQINDSTFKGRITAGVGNVETLTASQATSILDVMEGDAGTGGAKGLVPAQAIGDATKFLRGDGTWQTVSGSVDLLRNETLDLSFIDYTPYVLNATEHRYGQIAVTLELGATRQYYLKDLMVTNAGINYQVNDVLTVDGGTYTTQAQILVTSVDINGSVESYDYISTEEGEYEIFPNGYGTTFSGGSGTGFIADTQWEEKGVELVFDDTLIDDPMIYEIVTYSSTDVLVRHVNQSYKQGRQLKPRTITRFQLSGENIFTYYSNNVGSDYVYYDIKKVLDPLLTVPNGYLSTDTLSSQIIIRDLENLYPSGTNIYLVYQDYNQIGNHKIIHSIINETSYNIYIEAPSKTIMLAPNERNILTYYSEAGIIDKLPITLNATSYTSGDYLIYNQTTQSFESSSPNKRYVCSGKTQDSKWTTIKTLTIESDSTIIITGGNGFKSFNIHCALYGDTGVTLNKDTIVADVIYTDTDVQILVVEKSNDVHIQVKGIDHTNIPWSLTIDITEIQTQDFNGYSFFEKLIVCGDFDFNITDPLDPLRSVAKIDTNTYDVSPVGLTSEVFSGPGYAKALVASSTTSEPDYIYALSVSGNVNRYTGYNWMIDYEFCPFLPNAIIKPEIKCMAEVGVYGSNNNNIVIGTHSSGVVDAFSVYHYSFVDNVWNQIGTLDVDINAITAQHSINDPLTNIYVGTNDGEIYHYNGTTWSLVGTCGGTSPNITSMAYDRDSDILYVGGTFDDIDSVADTLNVAMYDGVNWMPIDTGVGVSGSNITRVKLIYGNLYVCGDFTDASGVTVKNIAKWDGLAWSGVGYGITGYPTYVLNAVELNTNDDVFVGGESGVIKKFDGVAWIDITPTFSGGVGTTNILDMILPYPSPPPPLV